MVNAIVFQSKLGTFELLDHVPTELSEEAVVWVDVSGTDLDGLPEAQKTFGLHDLAIETCKDVLSRPRMMDYDAHMFVVLNPVVGFDADNVVAEEVGLFLGDRFLVTVHSQPATVLTDLLQQYRDTPGLLNRGVDYVFYLLMDHLTDQYFALLDELDDRVDKLEDRVVVDPNENLLSSIFLLKRQLVQLRRIIGPQREVFAMLNNREFPYIQRQTLVYFRDVYEHLIHVYEVVDSQRDLLSGLLEAYLSTVSNRMNQVMKTLTIIATIFMPLTLLTSLYGMNFKFIPELQLQYGYFILLGVMAGITAGMAVWFRKKKWF